MRLISGEELPREVPSRNSHTGLCVDRVSFHVFSTDAGLLRVGLPMDTAIQELQSKSPILYSTYSLTPPQCPQLARGFALEKISHQHRGRLTQPEEHKRCQVW